VQPNYIVEMSAGCKCSSMVHLLTISMTTWKQNKKFN